MVQTPSMDECVRLLISDLQSDPKKESLARAEVANFKDGQPLRFLGADIFNAVYQANMPRNGPNYDMFIPKVTVPLGFVPPMGPHATDFLQMVGQRVLELYKPST